MLRVSNKIFYGFIKSSIFFNRLILKARDISLQHKESMSRCVVSELVMG